MLVTFSILLALTGCAKTDLEDTNDLPEVSEDKSDLPVSNEETTDLPESSEDKSDLPESSEDTTDFSVLSEETLKNKMIGITNGVYSWEHGYLCQYIKDYDDCILDGMYCAIDTDIKNFDDLRKYLSDYYSDRVVDEIISNTSLKEENGKLYTLNLGVGGTTGGLVCIEINAVRKDKNSYDVSICYSEYVLNGDEWIPSGEIIATNTYTIIYEDEDWVFDEMVDEFGLTITDDVVFSVK